MKISQILQEANLAQKIKNDARTLKMFEIAWRHDPTVPREVQTLLGPRATPQQIADFWGNEVDKLLRADKADSDLPWPDLSAEGKFDDWVLKIYTTGANDWEDITGEAVDRLGKFAILRNKGILQPGETDLARYRDLETLNRVLHKYNPEVQTLITAARVEKAKKNAQSMTLIDNDRFHVSVPLNYGACYVFNHQTGHQSTFCTGSSTGMRWFKEYSDDGPLIDVLDKKNANKPNGKWQIHAPSKQISNSTQTTDSDEKFANLFPGLLSEIITQMLAHATELHDKSQNIQKGGWDIRKAVAQLKRVFPKSTASVAIEQKPTKPAAG